MNAPAMHAPSWDSSRGMWLVCGEAFRTYAEAREAQSARVAIARGAA